jgi:CheY-like chemotaxis protein
MPDAPLPVLTGTPTPATAALRTAIHAGSITIAVKDSGAGLTPVQLESICAEGVQFNANQLQAGQGSGLGLFISKGIIDQHGGKLTITSEGLGKGVTFSLEMPIYREPAPRASLSREHSITSSAGSKSNAANVPPPLPSADVEAALLAELQNQEALRVPLRTRHLLVVDDSPFNRKMLCRLLSTKGYQCEQAEDGAESIKVYNAMIERGDAVDAILMDFEMPVMNGPTATAKLREQGCTCLIIGVTGNVLPDEQEYFRSRGANYVLPKPFKMEDFELIMGEQPSRPRLHSSEKVTVATKHSENSNSFTSRRANSSQQIHPMEEVV